jgi:hypothetical protein
LLHTKIDLKQYRFLSTIMSLSKLRAWDVRRNVNMSNLQKDFQNLKVDRYLKDGYRHKHITRVLVGPEKTLCIYYDPCNRTKLYQSSEYNPIHGDINRFYPKYDLSADSYKVLHMFIGITNAAIDTKIMVQAQRITCTSCEYGYPSIEHWHRDGSNKIGIMCVSRSNIIGGFNEFRTSDDKHTFFSDILEPGNMLTFEDSQIEHRITPIASKDMINSGYRDVIIMSW